MFSFERGIAELKACFLDAAKVFSEDKKSRSSWLVCFYWKKIKLNKESPENYGWRHRRTKVDLT
ncbi:hypothetical protein DRJ25_03290 [Candidatus Woesearchaeota archaeon]|nr:MAG: hypothetical protein DRJ25_03290 [Candidatus Woesearchaeota archaeon]